MDDQIYKKLAEFLDKLPGGYPPTENGIEIEILKDLFTPEDANITLHLSMDPEPADKIAHKLSIPEEEALEKLRSMANRGLIFSIDDGENPPVFMAVQFLIGIWEHNVENLTKEFIEKTNKYFPTLGPETQMYLPQLRVVPVDKSVDHQLEIMDYERAKDLVKMQDRILVAPCICHNETRIMGGKCEKRMERCLMFGHNADYYNRNGVGRMIDIEEALSLLDYAEKECLVIQPSNNQEPINMCLCCGDCCQALKFLQRFPYPARIVSSSFHVVLDEDECTGCEICIDRCQMSVLKMGDEVVEQNIERCIGCGLCVSTCPTNALTLVRREDAKQSVIPKSVRDGMMVRMKNRQKAKEKRNSA